MLLFLSIKQFPQKYEAGYFITVFNIDHNKQMQLWWALETSVKNILKSVTFTY